MTPNNVPVASATLACDRDFKDKSGEKQTDFIDVVVWRQTAEFFAKNFSKGRMAIVEGRLRIREWTDKEGNKRRKAEVLADSVYFGDAKVDRTSVEHNPAFTEINEPDEALPF
jgi:single-strand DNA-binding protein